MLSVKDFSLRHTVESGQPLTFHSEYSCSGGVESLSYVTNSGWIRLRYSASSGSMRYSCGGSYDNSTAQREIMDRLGLSHDMKVVYKSINTDRFMASAISRFHGMRITKNDPWETTLCFVISQFNNIKRIRGITKGFIERFGALDSSGRHLFPTAEDISSASLGEIRACGTGFRDRYIKGVAEQFAGSFDPESLYGMGYHDAKERLMELDGIGDKVADCILLFGYNKMEAFPIDTWVKRVIEKVYFKGRKRGIKDIHSFVDRTWPSFQGYAQQYIFWYGRESNIG